MKIFITGGSGFVGKALVTKLTAEQRTFEKIYLLMRKHSAPVNPPFEIVNGNLDTMTSCRDIIMQCDYVFHLAANATFGDDFDYDASNFKPTVILVDILKKSTCLKNFVFISTIGAVDREPRDDCKNPLSVLSGPHPRSRYGASKLKAEHYIQASGIPFTIIRPAWVYGRDMRTGSHINRFVAMACEGHPAVRFAFPGKVSLIHADVLVLALVRCISNPSVIGRIYFAETEALAIGEILAIIVEKLRGVRPTQIPIPSFSSIIGKLHSFLPLSVANLFVSYLWANDERFRNDFNLSSPVSFRDGIMDVIDTNIKVSGNWVITGANSGIGLALTKKLTSVGKMLTLIDKDTNNLSHYVNASIIQADLTKESEIDRVCSALSHLKIACLINNAGIGVRGPIWETSTEAIKQIVAINALAPVLLTRKIIENLIMNEAVIVNLASSIAYNPLPYMSLYSSTKAFLSNWSESLTYELRKTNLVITFSPSGTMTNFQKSAGVKVMNEGKGLLSPEYVADRILSAICRKKKVVILGLMTNMFLLFARFLPRKININIWGKLFERYR